MVRWSGCSSLKDAKRAELPLQQAVIAIVTRHQCPLSKWHFCSLTESVRICRLAYNDSLLTSGLAGQLD